MQDCTLAEATTSVYDPFWSPIRCLTLSTSSILLINRYASKVTGEIVVMDIKSPLPLPLSSSRPPETASRPSQLNRALRLIFIALVMYGIWGFLLPLVSLPLTGQSLPEATSKIALEAHIMSKCPDAKDCLVDLILPTMQQVSDRVDFQLSYIGRSVVD